MTTVSNSKVYDKTSQLSVWYTHLFRHTLSLRILWIFEVSTKHMLSDGDATTELHLYVMV